MRIPKFLCTFAREKDNNYLELRIMKSCPKCQHQNEDEALFCSQCGTSLTSKRTKKSLLERVNTYVGNDKPAKLNWKVLFTDVFKKHTLDEAEEIFIAGTKSTTPILKNVTATWPHPWLYSRVLTACILSFAILLCSAMLFDNTVVIPGIIMLGSFAIPVATLVLFMEMNIFRDVSFYEIAKFFLIGGCASILLTLILDSYFFSGYLTTMSAIVIGIIEETAKLLMIFFFIRKTPYRSILAGLLIGAAIGSGFAAFESAGYAFDMLLDSDNNGMLLVIGLRALVAPGGHIAWGAITGAALMIAANHGDITPKLMFKPEFTRLFIIPVVLHALWDMPWCSYVGYALLLIGVWVLIMLFFNVGLNEAEKMVKESSEEN
ncbi:MAG: PrsW family glutamic-type intramembrane protease [Paludibacteraceae bacterium]|nr:PrsW family glutamic-type intramembrane protease [Paludibacteraceae bacterium]